MAVLETQRNKTHLFLFHSYSEFGHQIILDLCFVRPMTCTKKGLKTTNSSIVKQNQKNCRTNYCRTSQRPPEHTSILPL